MSVRILLLPCVRCSQVKLPKQPRACVEQQHWAPAPQEAELMLSVRALTLCPAVIPRSSWCCRCSSVRAAGPEATSTAVSRSVQNPKQLHVTTWLRTHFHLHTVKITTLFWKGFLWTAAVCRTQRALCLQSGGRCSTSKCTASGRWKKTQKGGCHS